MATNNETIDCIQIIDYVCITEDIDFKSNTNYIINDNESFSFDHVYFRSTLTLSNKIDGKIINKREETVYTFSYVNMSDFTGKLTGNNPDIIFNDINNSSVIMGDYSFQSDSVLFLENMCWSLGIYDTSQNDLDLSNYDSGTYTIVGTQYGNNDTITFFGENEIHNFVFRNVILREGIIVNLSKHNVKITGNVIIPEGSELKARTLTI